MNQIMKSIIKTLPTITCAAAFCAVVLAGPAAQANQITGSIGFGRSYRQQSSTGNRQLL